MELTGISASDPAIGQRAPESKAELDRGAFMNLLVAQLQHQDPLSPTGSEDFVAQLSSFSSLEQLEELNQGIFAMISLNQSNALLSQLTQGSALIGKEVTWNDPDTGVEQAGEVTSVKIENGLPFLSVDGQDVPL
ncbi:MAG: flagellar basal-body rod modification protein FlgD, partial [Planctomycetota bacterium]